MTWGRAITTGLALAGTTLFLGCLEEPSIEERWTRVDVLSSSVVHGTAAPTDSLTTLRVRAAVTFRSVLTGFLVAELRVADSLGASDVLLEPNAERLAMAHDIDRLLANSVTAGRATRAVTGWDHLIHEIDLEFEGRVPAAVDSGGAVTGAFLVTYLGEGDEMRLEDGSDSLVVTPYLSDDHEILPFGFELTLPEARGAR